MAFRVLFIYPNFRGETVVPPAITLLSRILKNHGFEVDVFDTTDYGIDLAKDYEKRTEEALGVRPAEHRTLMRIDRDPWEDLNEKINSFSPDLLAISATESTFLLGIECIQNIKGRTSKDLPTVLGGSFATFAPRRALDFPEIDMVCIGEGENMLLELCQKMQAGQDTSKIRGMAYRDRHGQYVENPPQPVVDVNANPSDFDLGLFDKERLVRPMTGEQYVMAPVETIRGCPYSCAFCNSRLTKPRKKSFEKVREELLYYRDNHGIEYNFFWADTFLLMNRREVAEFCEMYQDIGLPFWIQTRVETINDWRLEPLIDVGLDKVAIGIENGHEQFRREVVLKEFTNDVAINAAEILSSLGITYNTNNMVGYPKETMKIAMETVELNRKFPNVDTTNCFTFTPYYGTPARDEAVKYGFMGADTIAPGNADDSILQMPQFPEDDIRQFRKVFAMLVKFPRERWPEIWASAKDNSEAQESFSKLHLEYQEEFFGQPNPSF